MSALCDQTALRPSHSAELGLLDAIAMHASERGASLALSRFRPDSTSPAEIFTYLDVWTASGTLATQVRNAVPAGGRMLLNAGDSFEHIAWCLAAFRAGAFVCPFDPAIPPAALSRLITEMVPHAAVTAACSPAHTTLVRMDSAAARAAVRTHEAADVPVIPPHIGGGLILQSSGTTGSSKFVVRTLESLSADARQITRALSLTPRDRIAAAVPLCHSYGADFLVAALFSGCELCVLEEFNVAALADLLADRATIFPGIPFMYEGLLRLPPRPLRVRKAISAGSPLPAAVERAVRESWSLRIGQLYGMTELGSVTYNDPETFEFNPASVGMPMHGVSVRIVDPGDATRELAIGAEGHIAVRASSMLSHYLPLDEPHRVNGHFLTGDLGRLNFRGELFITGRLKLMIDIAGRKVNPLEVEAALLTCDGVSASAVIGVAASATVMRLHAFVVPREAAFPPAERDMRGHLKTSLAAYKIPRAFEIVSSLPRSQTGKLLRSQLPERGSA